MLSAGRDPLADPEKMIRRVYAYVAYRLGDGPDADDVTADVFERALRYRASYDPAKGEPIAWLIGIARRSIQDRSRHDDPLALDDATAPGDLETEAVGRIDMVAAIQRLALRDRELIALRYGADLPARQIAEILGLSTNAVEVALHRALARLRSDLGETTV
jgi:RNA polymerase sigma-70 factor (ECF subfamily)